MEWREKQQRALFPGLQSDRTFIPYYRTATADRNVTSYLLSSTYKINKDKTPLDITWLRSLQPLGCPATLLTRESPIQQKMSNNNFLKVFQWIRGLLFYLSKDDQRWVPRF